MSYSEQKLLELLGGHSLRKFKKKKKRSSQRFQLLLAEPQYKQQLLVLFRL